MINFGAKMNAIESDKGFTLLEVVLSVAVMAMAFGALYPIFAQAPQRLAATAVREAGVVRAEALMDQQLLFQNWSLLPTTGEDENWHWTIEEIPFEKTGATAGRPLHLRVTLEGGSAFGKPVILDRIVWIEGT